MPAALTDAEKRRRHAAREKERRAGTTPEQKRRRKQKRHQQEGRRQAQKRAEGVTLGPQNASPTETRLAIGRTWKPDAWRDPAATMRPGLYDGEGVLVGPVDFEAWVEWQRTAKARRA